MRRRFAIESWAPAFGTPTDGALPEAQATIDLCVEVPAATSHPMAANGAARLEAIFLDEGFGTLDPETLDTVAAALEELGARGRMVGVVTHVAALADRLPVRYEVRKDGRTSQVTRTAI